MEEVVGSIPTRSTKQSSLAPYLSGPSLRSGFRLSAHARINQAAERRTAKPGSLLLNRTRIARKLNTDEFAFNNQRS